MTALPHEATAPRGSTRSIKLVGAVLLLTIVGLGGWVFVRVRSAKANMAQMEQQRRTAAARANEAPEVDAVRVLRTEWLPTVVATGTLEPIQAADLGFEVGGRVARVEAQLGAVVRAGEVLATLDRASVGAQGAQASAGIAVAEANVSLVRDRVQRLEGLAGRGAVPEAELTGARQQLALAEAQLSQAMAGRRVTATISADHTLRAPFAGVVTRAPAGAGAVAGPGVPLFRIEDLSAFRLRSTVAEEMIANIRVGAEVEIEGTDARGTVRSVVRSLDTATRRAPIEISVPNAAGTLIGNSFVRVRIPAGERAGVLVVPTSAVTSDGRMLVIENGQTRDEHVRVIDGPDGRLVLTHGGAENQLIVLRSAEVRAGIRVRAVEPRAATPQRQ